MNVLGEWITRRIWLGAAGAALLLMGAAPRCRAQEVNPDHFTTTGMDEVNAKGKAKAMATGMAKLRSAVSRQARWKAAAPSNAIGDKARAGEFVRVSEENRSAGGKRAAQKE